MILCAVSKVDVNRDQTLIRERGSRAPDWSFRPHRPSNSGVAGQELSSIILHMTDGILIVLILITCGTTSITSSNERSIRDPRIQRTR